MASTLAYFDEVHFNANIGSFFTSYVNQFFLGWTLQCTETIFFIFLADKI